MSDTAARIRTAIERNRKVLARRPSVGQNTAVTRVRVRDGMTCDIEAGSWTLTADMSEKYGGRGEGPDPGVLGRAGLGSCLAIGYMIFAARRGVPIDDLTVEVQADYDVRGELAVDDSVSPAYSEIRLVVEARSSAPEAEVAAVLDEAERYSPWLTIIRDPMNVVVERTITRGAD